jgi:glycine cleavage system H lipoate-binding protein
LPQVNSEPFAGGWMMKVKLSSSDTSNLLDAGAYKAHCDAGGH